MPLIVLSISRGQASGIVAGGRCGWRLLLPLVFFLGFLLPSPSRGASLPLGDFLVTAGVPGVYAITLPGGADFIDIRGD
jgi:hypothetical protein